MRKSITNLNRLKTFVVKPFDTKILEFENDKLKPKGEMKMKTILLLAMLLLVAACANDKTEPSKTQMADFVKSLDKTNVSIAGCTDKGAVEAGVEEYDCHDLCTVIFTYGGQEYNWGPIGTRQSDGSCYYRY